MNTLEKLGGRKFVAMWFVLAFAGLTFAGEFIQSAIPLFAKVDTGRLLNVVWAMAAIAGAFIGAEGAKDFRLAGRDQAPMPAPDVPAQPVSAYSGD